MKTQDENLSGTNEGGNYPLNAWESAPASGFVDEGLVEVLKQIHQAKSGPFRLFTRPTKRKVPKKFFERSDCRRLS